MKNLLISALTVLFALVFAAPALADEANTHIACKTCGLCPAPFGICIFYYIIFILVVLFVIVFLSYKTKRCPLCKVKCNKNDDVCPKCGYDFESGLQSTLTIRVADSPELMALRGQTRPKESAKGATASQEPLPPTPAQKVTDHKKQPDNLSRTATPINIPQSATVESRQPGIQKMPSQKSDSSSIILPSVAPADENNPAPSANICPNCGAALKPKARFCGKCGQKLQ